MKRLHVVLEEVTLNSNGALESEANVREIADVLIPAGFNPYELLRQIALADAARNKELSITE